ncbi:Dabb family protein [Membranihabitans marinus]|nr:Dabb family protein [Membranihabitans marinus]
MIKSLLSLIVFFMLSGGFFSTTTQAQNSSQKLLVSKSNNPEQASQDKKLRHVVLFGFKEDATPADIRKVEEAFSALPGKIPQIKDYEWGINNSPEGLNDGLTHCFLVTFESEDDRAIYLPHPEHKAFVDVLKPHLEKAVVVDYWTNE